VGFAGGNGNANGGRMFLTLKPVRQRKATADQVINRLRAKLAVVPGATLFLQAAQDLNIGGRQGNAQFQYTLQSENLQDLRTWSPRILEKLHQLPELKDVNSDQQDHGLEAQVIVDRDTAARLGVSSAQVDNALYDSFGQRQVSNIYKQLNQYHVVMEVAPEFQRGADALQNVYVRASSGRNGCDGRQHTGTSFRDRCDQPAFRRWSFQCPGFDEYSRTVRRHGFSRRDGPCAFNRRRDPHAVEWH